MTSEKGRGASTGYFGNSGVGIAYRMGFRRGPHKTEEERGVKGGGGGVWSL